MIIKISFNSIFLDDTYSIIKTVVNSSIDSTIIDLPYLINKGEEKYQNICEN